MPAIGVPTSGSSDPSKPYIAPQAGKWDETRPQGHRESEQRSFGSNGKKKAAEALERQRRSLGKKKKRR